MRNFSVFRSKLASRACRRSSYGSGFFPTNRSLRFESLEHRCLLSITVDTLVDEFDSSINDGDISLRDAIAAAPSGETIDFDAGLDGGTIVLLLGELEITDSLTIDASSLAAGLTIDAVGNDLISPGTKDGTGTRVLNVDDGNIYSTVPVSISGLTITGGDASGDGGGILSHEDLTLVEVRITGNASVGANVRGGGLFSYGGNLSIDRSTISGNSVTGTDSTGGGIYSTTRLLGMQSTLITNSTISDNDASSHGGGVFTGNNLEQDQQTQIVNSTISGNTSGSSGGGIFGFDGATAISYSTITDNTAPEGFGGGIASYGDLATLTELRSSIISGNSGKDLAIVSGDENSLISLGYNIVGDGNTFGPVNQFSALDNFNVAGDQIAVFDAGLAALADNGGPTWTHALVATSLALDAGDPSAQANQDEVPEFDQRGTPYGRVTDGNEDSTPVIDIGAFELSAAPTDPSADFDEDLVIGGLDFLAWQRGFGTLFPNAVKANGDADNDLDVDENDFNTWESQFGQAAPLMAMAFQPEGATFNLDVYPESLTNKASTASDSSMDQAANIEPGQLVTDVGNVTPRLSTAVKVTDATASLVSPKPTEVRSSLAHFEILLSTSSPMISMLRKSSFESSTPIVGNASAITHTGEIDQAFLEVESFLKYTFHSTTELIADRVIRVNSGIAKTLSDVVDEAFARLADGTPSADSMTHY